MAGMRQDRNLTQVVIGLGVLALGVIFTLDNVGVIDARDYLRYWPVILIGVGFAQIVQSCSWSAYTGALVWVVVGLWLLGRNTGLIRVGVWDVWPLVLAGVGGLLVFRGWRGYDARRGRTRGGGGGSSPDAFDVGEDGWITPTPSVPSPPPAGRTPDPFVSSSPAGSSAPAPPGSALLDLGASADPRMAGGLRDITTLNAFVIMGGITRRLTTLDFKGGSATAIMGGAKIDLRQASIGQGEAVLDVLAFWGGIEIRVPEDWLVVPQIFPFMGGFDDRTGPPPVGTRKRLIVRGLAFMGGVEVRH